MNTANCRWNNRLWLALLALIAAPQARAHDVELAELAFVQAIAGRTGDLDTLLHGRFAYRTTEGTTLGKAALIAYLRRGDTRVSRANLGDVERIESGDTVVSAGELTVTAATPADPTGREIRSRFVHVWVREGSGAPWQLLFREARINPPAASAASTPPARAP